MTELAPSPANRPILVRRVAPDDVDTLRQTRLAALADAPSAFASTYETEASYPDVEWRHRAESWAEGAGAATFLAWDGGDAVGIVGGFREAPDSDEVELVSMWTAAPSRRSGVARLLIDAVVDWAAETGASSVGLWVTRGNVGAQRLYEAYGFEPTGDHQPLPSDPCKDEVRMTLALRDR